MSGTYNGYTNYETWAVALWIDNNQGDSEYWQEQAGEAISIHELADQIKETHEEALPEVSGFAADLLNAAMSEVNWYELAENMWRETHGAE